MPVYLTICLCDLDPENNIKNYPDSSCLSCYEYSIVESQSVGPTHHPKKEKAISKCLLSLEQSPPRPLTQLS